jgi:hypothetical protein
MISFNNLKKNLYKNDSRDIKIDLEHKFLEKYDSTEIRQICKDILITYIGSKRKLANKILVLLSICLEVVYVCHI